MNLSVKNKGFKYGFCESFSVNYFIFDCSDCSHYEYHVFFLDRTGRLQSLFVFYDIASYTATDIITLGSAPPGVGSGATPYIGQSMIYTQIGAGAPGSAGNYSVLNIASPGIYLFTFCINQIITTTGTAAYSMIIGTNANAIHYGYSVVSTGAEISFQGSQIVTCTATNYNLQVNYAGFGFGNFSGFFYATRIA